MKKTVLLYAVVLALGLMACKSKVVLEQCSFIRRYNPVKGRTAIYQLIDFYSLFYFQFLNESHHFDRDAWLHFQATPRHNTWLGLSFGRLCFAHLYAIQKARKKG